MENQNWSRETVTPQHEKKERISSLEKLKTVMARIADEVNRDVTKKYGLDGLVDDSLHLDAGNFSKDQGGIYEGTIISEDQDSIDALDRYNCSADNERTQKFYKDEYGIETPEGIVAKHREKKEASKSNQAEMIITALLHKVLKERFLVVRASVFDDYKHGIDNLILDKETGAVICAFDEVLENEGDKERGAMKKIEKIKRIAVKGGTEAKYGVALKEQKLVRSSARNIPVFYLTLESKDLIELADDLFEHQEGSTTKAEEKLFAHLVQSIKEQKEMLQKLNLPQVMKRKLVEFDTSLAVLESFVGVRD